MANIRGVFESGRDENHRLVSTTVHMEYKVIAGQLERKVKQYQDRQTENWSG